MRSTAVVRAWAEPRRPRRQANGGVTAGREIRSTSTAAIRIADDHHTNDQLLSSPIDVGFLLSAHAESMCADDPLAGELAVASDAAPRRSRGDPRPSASSDARATRRERSGGLIAAVRVDRANDREPDLVAGAPSSRSRGTPGRRRGIARSRRTASSICSRLSASAASSSSVSRVGSSPRHLLLEHPADGDQVVEQRPCRWSYSSAIRITTGSSRFQAMRGWTVVPRPCSTRTRPRSSSSFRPSRITVRLKPNCSHEHRLRREAPRPRGTHRR